MKTLKSFEFKAGVGAKGTYDWDSILSGKIVLLERGTDYQCKDTTMATLIRNAAKKRGQTVQTNKAPENAGLVVKSSEPAPGNGEATAAPTGRRKREAAPVE